MSDIIFIVLGLILFWILVLGYLRLRSVLIRTGTLNWEYIVIGFVGTESCLKIRRKEGGE